jgi:hypothetical protein
MHARRGRCGACIASRCLAVLSVENVRAECVRVVRLFSLRKFFAAIFPAERRHVAACRKRAFPEEKMGM